jgi:phosphoglycerate dehydrogenase-like enzyme
MALAPGPRAGNLVTRAERIQAAENYERVRGSILEAGGEVVDVDAANALAWLGSGEAESLAALLDAHPAVSWVQLPWAGVDEFISSGLFQRPVTFTSAKGALADQVAEHALLLALASMRHVVAQARHRHWLEAEPESLHGKRVTIVGGGGIGRTVIRLLSPLTRNIVVLRRQTEAIPGAATTRPITDLHAVLPETDVLILALALTAQTHGIVGGRELSLLPAHAILVNVARGAHVDTDALVSALREREIAAAGLDVTDPEPLPPNHPLWDFDNVLITSHCADSVAFVSEQLAKRIRENIGRFKQGQPLAGVVDPLAGY